jgi:hypothetical protein
MALHSHFRCFFLRSRRVSAKHAPSLLVCLVAGLVFVPYADAQSGMISGSPNPCIIAGGQSLCTSTISWSSSGTSQVQVWVSVNGGAESNFGTTGVGGPYSEDAPWIQGPPNSYVFNLYDYSSGSRGALLASTSVTGTYSISLTWGNTSNSAITPDMVVEDYWTLSISGAAPSAPIVLALTKNGGALQYYTLAYTDGNGNYSRSEQVFNDSVGTYTNQ